MNTTPAEFTAAIEELDAAKHRFAALSPAQRSELVTQCIAMVAAVAESWIAAARQAKSPPDSGVILAEEIVNGPAVTLRFLHLTRASLDRLARGRPPQLPGSPTVDASGRVWVPLFPTRELFDSLSFVGFSAQARMLPEVTLDNLRHYQAPQYAKPTEPAVALVLGAGNVSSIPIVDVLSKLFHEGQVVLLKMNPVNEYLGPIFQQALAPVIAPGFVRIIYGGGEIGSSAIAHPSISTIHITGSAETHDAIVWGASGAERDRRKQIHQPLLQKPITSELGNVSPWIVVPGQYTRRQLEFQAENIAASITNNASFNCVATKLIITHRSWPERTRFLELIDAYLQKTPRRRAYYPGAVERYRRFACDSSSAPKVHETWHDERLPWKLRRDINPQATPHLVQEESFVCVCAETAIDGTSPEDFLRRSVDFVNEEVWGTLCAALTVPPTLTHSTTGAVAIDAAIDQLKYGAICINHWPALVYALMSTPWGGHPGSDLADIQSGRGWVHNTYMLHGIEKSVLRGPLTVFPKPIWFPLRPHPERPARRMLELYAQPSWSRWLTLLVSAASPV